MNKQFLFKAILVVMFGAFTTSGYAQWDDDGDDDWGYGDEESADTTETDSLLGDDDTGEYMDGAGWGADDGGSDETVKYKFQRPAYERIQMPFDTIRELIYYTEVIEEEDCEECMADSLYWRSMNFLKEKYGKRALKKFISEDKKMQKIVLTVKEPMLVKQNKFANKQDGDYEYKIILRFQDFRYKYDMSNFVHITAPVGVQKDEQRTYMEYYLKSEKDVEANDKLLRTIDSDVKKFVEDLKKALKDPPFLGQDLDNDW